MSGMNRVDEIYASSQTAESFADGYLSYLESILRQLDRGKIAKFIDILEAARQRQAQIFFIGNGGSAATASHFANDIGIGTRTWAQPFRAISLTDNVAVITAIGNDFGYDEVFSRQLQVTASPEDVVVAISASGNSPNVLKAISWAKERGLITVGLTGFDGGELAKASHLNLHVPSAKGEYGPVEDCHMVLDHLVGAYLMKRCRDEESRRANRTTTARPLQSEI